MEDLTMMTPAELLAALAIPALSVGWLIEDTRQRWRHYMRGHKR
jgi:hypothetical protein